jgi:hypothetical protein
MRIERIAILLLLFAPLFSSATPPQTLSLEQYIAALQQLRQAVPPSPANAAKFTAPQLPPEWHVAADAREFSVSTADLRQSFNEFAKQRTPANRDAVSAQLDLLLRDAQAMQATTSNFSAEHNKLAEVLARREFRNLAGESWYDRLKRAAQLWVLHLLQRIFTSSAFPAVGRVVIWTLVALAIAALAWWLVRNYREKNIYPQFSGAPDAISAKPWRDWQAEAQLAAQEGRWRDAVHLTYWAGISFLESQGLWRPDLARTPREYLRLLSSGDEHRAPLQQLTGSFEKIWNGKEAATAETFTGACAMLEQLGCR